MPAAHFSRGEILAAAAQRSVDNGIGALLAAVVLAGLGVLLAASPSPDLAFLLQVAATGAFVGTIVVYSARRRGIRVVPWLVTTRWSIAGFVGGLLILLVRALFS